MGKARLIPLALMLAAPAAFTGGRPAHIPFVEHTLGLGANGAVTLADLDGDGQKDFVTGKRYMAHNGKDPGEREPLGVYWYHCGKSDDGKRIEWSRHLIDYSTRAGGGMQIAVADLDGDGDLGVVTPSRAKPGTDGTVPKPRRSTSH